MNFFNSILCILSFLNNTIAFAPLQGVTVKSVDKNVDVDLGSFLSSEKSLLILGTYAADFNAIEYAQRLRYYMPKLRAECGIEKFGLVLNCNPAAAKAMCKAVDLSTDEVQLFIDPTGKAGRTFGVGRGWQPDNEDINPFLKLFGMLWGLGAWATLPAVIGGYIGNPFTSQKWIEDAFVVGMKQGRWPDNAIELNEADGSIKSNKFKDLPLVGSWGRPPLELATLRLQSMMGISLKQWDELAPDEESLQSGVLTQLGGCVVCNEGGEAIYEWRDPGICAVANFEDILKELKNTN
eukprot:CAMPEP_0194129642 /NCGR_PEP_ID=MMETSP0152-20130528/861_1 /TAXON_ID=1049557 /ORGANISM="Thalassiothrix antarctica, Strain L6-D1" /LENGTH=293 /DNA_ID=CAMNT_0038823941 /DNA_START=41 /DNA_END=922 /DNA_ORIENTATION=+